VDGISLDSGFPKEILEFRDILESEETPEDYRFMTIKVLMTLLSMGRAFKTPAVLDSSTITEP
jgi:hypothetical protein